jgi:hypothetical protein
MLIPFVAALAFAGLHHSESAAASPRYSDIVLSDSKGGPPKYTFKPNTPKLFMQAKLVDVPNGSTLKSDWIAEKTKVAPPNYKMDSSELKVNGLVNQVVFNFSKPDRGWPEGDYRIDLFIDNKPAQVVKFKVVK